MTNYFTTCFIHLRRLMADCYGLAGLSSKQTAALRLGVATSVLLLLPGAAHATVYYVDATITDNSGDGLSWATAKKDVQSAINLATTAGDEVWVKAGTYSPTVVPPNNGSVATTASDRAIYIVNNDLKLYGGFAGTEQAATQRNPVANVTTLSGNLNSTDAINHVLLTVGRSSACVIDGLTIQGGRAGSSTGNVNFLYSNGMYSATINRTGGGGMYNFSSAPTVSNCTFSGNSATGNGAGINNVTNASPTVSNCLFRSNTAGNGGGMCNNNLAAPSVSNCTFSANTASGSGGGMHNVTSSAAGVNRCTFIGNTAGNGGGINNSTSSDLSITNCVFTANSANSNGGAVQTNSSSPSMTNSTFSGNSSTSGLGGGVYYGTNGGGRLTNCIFYQNTTPGTNTDANREEIYKSATNNALTVSYCIVRDYDATATSFVTGSNIFTAAPGYVDVTTPIGPDNIWRTADDGLRITCTSFAADKGTGTTPTTDIVGNTRKGTLDLGAYEATGGTAPSNSIPSVFTTVSIIQTADVLPYTDCQNELLQLNATGAYTLRGSTVAAVRMQNTALSFGGQPYVRRYYDISPATDAATATAEVTLYFTQADFDDYNNASGTRPQLPTTTADPEGNAANLRISQQHGTSPSGAPGTYTGWAGSGPARVSLIPASVTYNTSAARWEVRFAVSGFSGFFVYTGAAPLPVQLVQFTAEATRPAAVRLAWATASEKNSARFEVERSRDGQNFAKVGEVAAVGSSSTARTYAYLDAAAPAGLLYYRLRQVDADGTATYSPVRLVTVAAGTLVLTPNPTHMSTWAGGLVAGAAVEVFDALGRSVLRTQADAAGQAALVLPAGQAPGLYLVRSGAHTARLVLE